MIFPVTTEKGALSVARVLGNVVTSRQVIKSLIFETSSGEAILVLVGGDQNVISGCLKKVVGDRNIKMASRERIRDVSGYEVGSIPPFCWQPPGFRTFIDASLLSEPLLAVGSGSWGNEILLKPAYLVQASSAYPVNLTNEEPQLRVAAKPADSSAQAEIPSTCAPPGRSGARD